MPGSPGDRGREKNGDGGDIVCYTEVLESSRNVPTGGEEHCVTTLKTAV